MNIIPENLEIHKANKTLENIIDNTKIKEKLLYKVKSDFHDIYVVKNKFGKFLKYKDTYQAGIFDCDNYKGNLPYINYFLIPYLMNKNAKNVLFIGMGSGKIINQYEILFEKLSKIDIVDIEEYIFPVAEKYFDFKVSDKMNFYLQDGIIYLKNSKTKYDIIITEIAGTEGCDTRLCEDEFFKIIKSRLTAKGIFVINLPSSRDIFNKKNEFFLNTLNNLKGIFSNINLYNGETSNKIFYKTFFNIDKPVFDITNAILICSNKNTTNIDEDIEEIYKKLNIKMEEYLKDKTEIQNIF